VVGANRWSKPDEERIFTPNNFVGKTNSLDVGRRRALRASKGDTRTRRRPD
jgi:hypothetical protein